MASGQVDKERVRQRVEEIYRLLLQGDSLKNIVQNSAKTWGVGETQAARAGYTLTAWAGYYCGHIKQMTHYLAELQR